MLHQPQRTNPSANWSRCTSARRRSRRASAWGSGSLARSGRGVTTWYCPARSSSRLCHVQELLGARDSETTEAYTHAPLAHTIRRAHLRESERSRRMLPNRY
jgi:hypothetical protein